MRRNCPQEGRLERNASVTVEYQDIAGGNYSHDWEIDPGLYEELRTQGYRNLNDRVAAVEKLSDDGDDGNSKEQSVSRARPRL